MNQETNERLRDEYSLYPLPLIHFLCSLHGLSIRDFAEIFSISKNHAEAVMKHRVLPDLTLAVRIARYFEVTVDDLFAWRIDDTGERRPLVVFIKEYGGWCRLRTDDTVISTLKAVDGGKSGANQVHSIRASGAPGFEQGISSQGKVGSEGSSDRDEREQEAEAVSPGVDQHGDTGAA